MSEGWIKLHRKLLDSAMFSRSEYLHVWITMLLLASHEEKEVIFNGAKMRIKPGSFISSRLKISARCKVQESKVKRIINYLKSDQQIDQVNMSTGSLFSITNWNKYQVCDQPNDHAVTSQWTASDQPVTTIKKGKNVKNVKNTTAFDEFWALYPKKVGKGAALKAWRPIQHCDGLIDKIRDTLAWEVKSEQWRKESGQFIPLPATWLNQERWNDEQQQKPAAQKIMSFDDLREDIKRQKAEKEQNDRLRQK